MDDAPGPAAPATLEREARAAAEAGAEPVTEGAAEQPPAELTPKRRVIGFGQHPYGDDEEREATSASRRDWYGWQTLLVDGAALSAVLVGTAVHRGPGRDHGRGDALAGVGLIAYGLGPGIVHFAHRNPGLGFASFGIRLGIPLAGAFLGASVVSSCDSYRCEEDGAAVGALLGMLGAIAIDAATFAYDDRRPRADEGGLSLAPVLSLQPGRAWLGLGGRL